MERLSSIRSQVIVAIDVDVGGGYFEILCLFYCYRVDNLSCRVYVNSLNEMIVKSGKRFW
jgi:hypothetical protein